MIAQQKRPKAAARKPAIALSIADFERLHMLVRAASKRMPALAEELANEIERARIFEKSKRQHSYVAMNSKVEFRDDNNGRIQQVTLVYPDQADTSSGKISILTPVGTALIGMPVGGTITWQSPYGGSRKLTVLSVQAGDGDAR
ncbi:MAG: nucleoside diphosphate kinase regulator [Xanthobacteraceae bacterium]|nr:nucleoside diphosphate kinase regulator [Xanthobacteraceae bacterium]